MKDEMIGCHYCSFEAWTLVEVWRHEEDEHPEEVEADAAEFNEALADALDPWRKS